MAINQAAFNHPYEPLIRGENRGALKTTTFEPNTNPLLNFLRHEQNLLRKQSLELNTKLRTHAPELAKTLSKKSLKLAKTLHKQGYLYTLYGLCDGFGSACTLFKYLNNVFDDTLRDWTHTEEGLAFLIFELSVVTAFSTMGNTFSDKSSNRLKRWTACAWPYFRDLIKGFKNAYKGLRTTTTIIHNLSGVPFQGLLLPAALTLGAMAAANRLLLRRMFNQRREMMDKNRDTLSDIQKSKSINQYTIERQSLRTRRLAFLGVAFGGLVDGMYMYIGVLGLVIGAVVPPVLFFMIACSALYLIACIATRLYEEYRYQKRLDISATKIELASTGKLLESQFNTLIQNYIQSPRDERETEDGLPAQKLLLINSILQNLNNFATLQKQLLAYQRVSWKEAFFMGVRHGLCAYSALTSSMFAAATILMLFSITMPTPVIIACVTVGLGLISLFLIHAFYKAYQYRQMVQTLDTDTQKTLQELSNTIKRHQDTVAKLKPEQVKDKLFGQMTVDPSPQPFFQEIFEIVRSFFSGAGKGTRTIGFTLGSYDEGAGDSMSRHDNIILLATSAVTSMVFASCLALRAFSKSFGRSPVDEEDEEEIMPCSSRPQNPANRHPFFPPARESDRQVQASPPASSPATFVI